MEFVSCLCPSPSSVSCHTMPSRLTLVPGSQGPRHSGSVPNEASAVFTATERVRTMICSQADEMSLLPTAARRWSGGGAGVEAGDSICDRDKRREVKGRCFHPQRVTGIWLMKELMDDKMIKLFLLFICSMTTQHKNFKAAAVTCITIPVETSLGWSVQF